MSEEHFYEKIKSVLDEIAEARSDNKITFAELMFIVGEVVDTAWHAWSALNDNDGHFNRLIEDAERAYADFVAVLDVKRIPNIVEKAVHRVVLRQIRPTLQSLRDLVD